MAPTMPSRAIVFLLTGPYLFFLMRRTSMFVSTRENYDFAVPEEGHAFSSLNQSVIADQQARIEQLEQTLRNWTLLGGPRTEKTKDSLPSCESLMQNHPSLADGSFLTRVPNRWVIRHDESRELQLPSTCILKRYTVQQASQCLAKKHINLIGDSLSRYQFNSLAYFLERGTFPPRFGTSHNCKHIDEHGKPACSLPNQPNMCMEGDWDSWKDFHSGMGGSTDGGAFHGRLECGCARWEGGGQKTTENALYTSKDGIRVSYISEVGWYETPDPIRGWKFTDCSEKGSCRSTIADSDAFVARADKEDWDFKEPLQTALNGTLQKMFPKVDITIYNRGHWNVMTEAMSKTIMPLLHDFVGEGRCFYRTTTAPGGTQGGKARSAETGYVKTATFEAGCGFLDFAHLTEDFALLLFGFPYPPKEDHGNIANFEERNNIFWDSVHFQPWVYEELNNVLLNVLCNGMKDESVVQ